MDTLTLPDLIDGAVRAALFGAEFAAAGLAGFMLIFGRPLGPCMPRLLTLADRAALSVLPLLLVHLLLLPARMAGEFSGVSDTELWEMTLRSSSAQSIALQFAAALLLLAGLHGRRRGASGKAAVFLFAGALAMAGGFLLTGHTALGHNPLLATLLLLHLLAAQFWVGALLALPALTRLEAAPLSAAIVERFSQRALWLVPLIPLAGVLLATLLLPNLRALRQPYGLMLIAKAGLTTMAFALAAANHWRLGPALGTGSKASRTRFRRSVTAETVVVALILTCAAALTTWFAPE